MDMINIILICLAGLGVILLAYAFFKQNGIKKAAKPDYDNLFNGLDGSVKEAENVMDELDDFSNSVKKDFDDKYQEMLRLYDLLEEKKQEIISLDNSLEVKTERRKKSFKPDNDKVAKIKSLYEQGYPVSKIAKILNIGQGEVDFTLNLSRGRAEYEKI